MATRSSILAWGIPWTEDSRGLWSKGLQRVGHDLGTKVQFSSVAQSCPILCDPIN